MGSKRSERSSLRGSVRLKVPRGHAADLPALRRQARGDGRGSECARRRALQVDRKEDAMCLAIPAKITEMKDDGLATVDILGVTRDIALDLTPQATLGDFVLVHAGFAIEVVDADYAQETIDLIKQFPELIGEEVPV